MKQIAQNYRSGELAVLDAPAPQCLPGGVLVRSLYSLISTGTELMKVSESRMSLVGKAKSRPDQVRKLVDSVAQQGPVSAYRKAMNRLDSYTPLGYSLAGVVIEAGAGAADLQVGQVVACGGNEFALHAEINWVPHNLCVPVPDGVPPRAAAFATLGAIAMQGVRQAEVQLGDTACVIGLGLVGQLVVQLLVAAGVQVTGLDVVPARCRLAEKAGALLCATPDEEGSREVERVLVESSGGLGADHIFLVAGGSSNGPVEAAARLARDRARIVDIGKCHLDLPWNAYYEKELEIRFSRSYGPGRYDPRYELEGIDYPPGYVRWTERRNMACFIDLLAKQQVDVDPLVSGIFPVDEAVEVYEKLHTGALPGVGYLFEYDSQDVAPVQPRDDHALTPRPGRRPTTAGDVVSLGFIGAGNYASTMLLPHLAHRPDVRLVRVATARSLSAVNAQRKFGFAASGTDPSAVLEDDSIDAVFIATRHSTHSTLVCHALEAGKTVFVEKPLALTAEELQRVLEAVESTGNDRIMVGFNRRFAPLLTRMKAQFGATQAPTVARYLVNAGPLPADSWYRDEVREGSRFVGEGGHFIDTLNWWIGEDPLDVAAMGTGEGGLTATLRYPDGSTGVLTYLTTGHPRFPKETFEASSRGRTARLDNFKRFTVWCGRRPRTTRAVGSIDKGQRGEIDAFLDAVREEKEMPVPLSSLAATTRATLAAAEGVTGPGRQAKMTS